MNRGNLVVPQCPLSMEFATTIRASRDPRPLVLGSFGVGFWGGLVHLAFEMLLQRVQVDETLLAIAALKLGGVAVYG